MSPFPTHQELKNYSVDELRELCAKLRQRILETTARQGGHLASSLGAVELTVALHKFFDFAGDNRLFFDVGHQSYAHKLLTGREKSFEKLRSIDGCSGFTRPEESPCDVVYAGHAGVAVSQALGAAQAKALKNEPGHSIAVIGDGSLGCGIVWEALNNIPSSCKHLLIILNDNQMSISPNIGALRKCLNRILSGRFYNRVRSVIRSRGERFAGFKRLLRRAEHAVKGLFMSDGVLFQELGIRYFGPVDGNDIAELCRIIPKLPSDRPVLLHLLTVKGKGYKPAETNPDDFHGISPFDITTGEPLKKSTSISFSDSFAQAVTIMAEQHPELVVISPAMLQGTGFKNFIDKYPERCFDTGIAESHSIAFASGLASQGLRPVVAIYSTFLQRALDNVFHDVCLNNLPVIIGIDRTGAVPDGPTHHGLYSLSFLRQMPNLTILAPSNNDEMQKMLSFAWQLSSPIAICYPRATCLTGLPAGIQPPPSLESHKAWIMQDPSNPNLTIWACGAEIARVFELVKLLQADQPSIQPRIVNPRFLLPFDDATAVALADTPQVILDDNNSDILTHCIRNALSHAKLEPNILSFTWPDNAIIPHGSLAELRNEYRLSLPQIASAILNNLRP
ncbi:MAG: 1-deoxy-D-xylulose-5-phosphate synthase [Victivallales bacterium]|nr:1-deoxy-D-xylulose-5-phosphate synthase [Victivallales bacterium]